MSLDLPELGSVLMCLAQVTMESHTDDSGLNTTGDHGDV